MDRRIAINLDSVKFEEPVHFPYGPYEYIATTLRDSPATVLDARARHRFRSRVKLFGYRNFAPQYGQNSIFKNFFSANIDISYASSSSAQGRPPYGSP
jgi:hypothetical protein